MKDHYIKTLHFRYQDLKLQTEFQDKNISNVGVIISSGIISAFQLKSEARDFIRASSDLSDNMNFYNLVKFIYFDVNSSFKCVVKDFTK